MYNKRTFHEVNIRLYLGHEEGGGGGHGHHDGKPEVHLVDVE